MAFPSGDSGIRLNSGAILEVDGAFAASGPPDGTFTVLYNSGAEPLLRTTGAGGVSLDGGTLRLGAPFDNAGSFGFVSPARVLLQSTVTNSGSFGGSDSLFVSNGSQFTNTGTVAPGLSGASAILPVVVTSSALPFGAEGRLEIELGGTEPGTGYDRLDVEGAVALGGELALRLLNDYVPELGQTFEVMRFTSRTGEFDIVTGRSLGNGLGLDPSYTDTAVILTVVEDGNAPPMAGDDAATTMEGVAVLIDVLANDSDPDGDDPMIANVGSPANGTAEVVERQISYTPNAGFAGTDSFDYVVSDGNGGTDDATVTVTVEAASFSCAAQSDVQEADCDALVTLYVSTGGDAWTNNAGWLDPGTPIAEWQGVTVVGDRVASLDLTDNGLTGTLPPAIGQLTAVSVLRLRINALTGEIPTEIGLLSQLEVLDLNSNLLTGAIPAGVWGLSNLQQLTLFINDLTGSIPPEIGQLTRLTSLGLGENALTGELPVEIGQLANLLQLDINTTLISGLLPASMGDLASLQSLAVNDTPLSGSIPLTFVALGSLGTFNFAATDLCEPVDPDFQAWLMGVENVTSSGVTCSAPPVAMDDAATTLEGTAVTIDVLANDSDPDGDELTIASVGRPMNGTSEAVQGQISYTPSAGFVGTDSFTYTVSDGTGGTDAATVTVSVTAASVVVEAEEEATSENGVPVTVNVTGFTPTIAELRYRPTGASAFISTPLTLNGTAYEGSVPAAAVTLRGVEYYVFLSDGETIVTFPANDPEANPSRIRARVAQQASAVAIPSNAEYRMVSVPLVLDDPSPLAVFGDDYGDYGVTSWRLLRWLPSAEQYDEGTPLDTPVMPGAGFWLAAYAEDDGPFDVEDGLSVDASAPVELMLQPGWNQIGNPFAFPVVWESVLGSDLVQPPASFDGAEYMLGEPILDPWVGYFVLNDTEESVTLQVPPTEVGQTLARGEVKEEQAYRLHLRADASARGLQRGLHDTQNVLGFADDAAVGPDRLDLAEPPPITSHLRLSAVEDGVRLGHSFRPSGTDGADWELELTASPDVLAAGPMSVRVALEEVGGRPDGYDVHVLDLDREVPLTLLEHAFEITLSAERPVQRLRLIAGTEAYADAARQGISLVPVAFALAPAYPNPFSGAATLAYELPEQADVVLDVFDLLGRRVAVLADGVQEAGRYTVRWDGTVAGAPAANGVYVYRLRAGSFTASHKMVLLR